MIINWYEYFIYKMFLLIILFSSLLKNFNTSYCTGTDRTLLIPYDKCVCNDHKNYLNFGICTSKKMAQLSILTI